MKRSLIVLMCTINLVSFAQQSKPKPVTTGQKTAVNSAKPIPAAVALQYDEIKPYTEDWAAFKTGNKWGFVDRQGRVVVEPQYDFEPYVKFGLVHVGIGFQKNAKIFDKTGNLRIDSSPYYHLNGFTDSLYTTACTFGDGAKGIKPERFILDRSGNIISKIENEGTYSGSVYCSQNPHEGRIWFCTKESYKQNGFLDIAGIPVISPKYVQVKDFSDNRAWVKKKLNTGEEFWGAIDRNGLEIVPFTYKDEPKRDFVLDRCFAWMGDYYILIDNFGKQLSPLKFKGAANFTSADATVARIEENYEQISLIIDYNGNVIKRFDKPVSGEQIFLKSGFNNGLATATLGPFGKMGAIDKTGKTVIPFEFESIDAFSCERAIASKYDKTGKLIEGMIDLQGNFVIVKTQ